MNNTKISIITVVFNGAKTIEQTINSVLNQSYKNIEYIIIDGGSTDGTQEIIEKYKESIACYISEPDDGIYDAMNKGLSRATGDIVGIINSDDWYELGAFEKVCDIFEKEDADIVYGDLRLIYEDGQTDVHMGSPLKNMCFEMAVPHPTVFIKREIYEQYGYFDCSYRIAADYDLILRLYMRGVKFKKVDEILANFRMTGISNTKGDVCIRETKRASEKHLALNILRNVFAKCRIEEGKNLLVYGAGNWGEWFIDKLLKFGFNDVKCVDRNTEKQGTQISGVVVNGLNEMIEFDGIIVVAILNSGEVLEQFKAMGIDLNCCVVFQQIKDTYCDMVESIRAESGN